MSKPNESDILAQLTAANASLEKVKATGLSIEELVAQHAALSLEKTQLTSDLATARQTIGTLTKERDDANAKATKLESEKTTFEQAVAAKVATLGITGAAKTPEQPVAKKKTLDDEIAEYKAANPGHAATPNTK